MRGHRRSRAAPGFAADGGTIDLDQLLCALKTGPVLPTKKMDETLCEIEEAQAALRDSIERARDLAEETDRLVHKHRTETVEPRNPQS
jgi:hypothetical protein